MCVTSCTAHNQRSRMCSFSQQDIIICLISSIYEELCLLLPSSVTYGAIRSYIYLFIQKTYSICTLGTCIITDSVVWSRLNRTGWYNTELTSYVLLQFALKGFLFPRQLILSIISTVYISRFMFTFNFLQFFNDGVTECL